MRRRSDEVAVVLADNPSPLTLEGTNTWLLGRRGSVVVDPGPDDAEHARRVAAAAPDVRLILVTHGHADHTGGIALLHELTGAPVRAADPAHCVLLPPLTDGESITVDDVALRVLATPGHTADSVCFELAGGAGVLTGDTVLGRGTTVIIPGDGNLADYLASLHRLAELPGRETATPVLPGHGPDLPDLAATARDYLAHRQQRLDQVRAALGRLGDDASARQVVELVYADVDRSLWPAAELSVQAQLEYLRSPESGARVTERE